MRCSLLSSILLLTTNRSLTDMNLCVVLLSLFCLNIVKILFNSGSSCWYVLIFGVLCLIFAANYITLHYLCFFALSYPTLRVKISCNIYWSCIPSLLQQLFYIIAKSPFCCIMSLLLVLDINTTSAMNRLCQKFHYSTKLLKVRGGCAWNLQVRTIPSSSSSNLYKNIVIRALTVYVLPICNCFILPWLLTSIENSVVIPVIEIN